MTVVCSQEDTVVQIKLTEVAVRSGAVQQKRRSCIYVNVQH